MSTRIIRITTCAECPFRYRYHYDKNGFQYSCELHVVEPLCPPTGIPDWCPLEKLETK